MDSRLQTDTNLGSLRLSVGCGLRKPRGGSDNLKFCISYDVAEEVIFVKNGTISRAKMENDIGNIRPDIASQDSLLNFSSKR